MFCGKVSCKVHCDQMVQRILSLDHRRWKTTVSISHSVAAVAEENVVKTKPLI